MQWLLCLALVIPLLLALPAEEYSLSGELNNIVHEKSLESHFREFKLLYDKPYADEYEEKTRKHIFEANLRYIEAHNELYDKGEKSYKLALNQFADLTHQEFLMYYTCRLLYSLDLPKKTSTYLTSTNMLLPDHVDWREKGYVTNVKNQGQCGSCWAFSSTGSLEGQHFHKTKNLISLSEQQLVDCSKPFGTEGCNGGWMDQAFQYIEAVGGIEGEADYPYTAREDTCIFDKSRVRAIVTGLVNITYMSEIDLQKAVAEVGPVSVAIDASHPSFQHYSSGLYNEPNCSSSNLDHAVLVVGYGTTLYGDFWLVKNSWDTTWGDGGYINMTRNKGNQCGIATAASYPLV